MEQEKAERAIIQQAVLEDIEEWLTPPFEGEALLASEISALPILRIPRENSDRLRCVGMRPLESYSNCVAFVADDPDAKATIIQGWWVRGQTGFAAHSVVKSHGLIACITPFFTDEIELEFKPDQELKVVEDGNGLSQLIRKGIICPKRVRLNPNQVISRVAWVRSRLRKRDVSSSCD